ncbi:MAG: hypothetical protein ACOC56_05425 [Atribacterota bacterium]
MAKIEQKIICETCKKEIIAEKSLDLMRKFEKHKKEHQKNQITTKK